MSHDVARAPLKTPNWDDRFHTDPCPSGGPGTPLKTPDWDLVAPAILSPVRSPAARPPALPDAHFHSNFLPARRAGNTPACRVGTRVDAFRFVPFSTSPIAPDET